MRAGGRGVAVFENQEHGIVPIEQGRLHAGQQTVMPKPAIAHDGQNTAVHVRRDTGTAGQAHAVAEDGVPCRKGLESAQRMATDVCGNVHRSDGFLGQLKGRKHRTFWATNAKTGWPHGQRLVQALGNRLAALLVALQPTGHRGGVQCGQHLCQPQRQACGDGFGGVLAAHRQHVFAVQGRVDLTPSKQGGYLLLNVFGLTFFDDQNSAFACTEVGNLFRHQGAGDVQDQGRYGQFSEGIGQTKAL